MTDELTSGGEAKTRRYSLPDDHRPVLLERDCGTDDTKVAAVVGVARARLMKEN